MYIRAVMDLWREPLDPMDKLAAVCVASHIDHNEGFATLSRHRIAREMGVSYVTACRALRRLVAAAYLADLGSEEGGTLWVLGSRWAPGERSESARVARSKDATRDQRARATTRDREIQIAHSSSSSNDEEDCAETATETGPPSVVPIRPDLWRGPAPQRIADGLAEWRRALAETKP